MIFATVGSHPTFRFDRLLRGLEAIPGDDLVVQHGPAPPPANAREAFPFISLEEMLERMNSATTVISHAGVGSILCALQSGRVPVVMPRKARFGETVDDHQVELARALAPTGRILLAESAAELPARIEEAGALRPTPAGDAVRLVAAIQDGLRPA